MRITNHYHLPMAIVRAIENDPYDNHGTLSATTLIKPPQMVALEKLHWDDLEEDASDRLWSLYGQSVHHIIDRAAAGEDYTEQRLYLTLDGIKVSGQFDNLTRDGVLTDYKLTSVWAIKDALEKGKPEWENQINILAALCREYGLKVERGEIIAMARDWRRSEAMRSDDYPRKVEVIPIPIWSHADAIAYIRHRVAVHLGNPQPCSDAERWYRGEKWAVMKKGRKSAVRLFDDEVSAQEFCDHCSSDHYLEHRPGTYVRCQDYCSVRDFCPQWRDDGNA